MIEEWKSKPAVVRKLSFLWAVFALYPICVCGTRFWLMRGSAGWVELLEGMSLSLPLAFLAWGHFKGWRAARWLGIALSLGWSVIALLDVPVLIDFVQLIYSSKGMIWSSSLTLFGILACVLLVSCSLLMLMVLFLSLSCAGRTAYGKRPRPGEDSALA